MSDTAAAAVTESTPANAVASEQANPSAPTPVESGAAATSKEYIQRLQRGESPATEAKQGQEAGPSGSVEPGASTTPAEPAAPPVVADEKGNLHGPDGKFVAKAGAEPEPATTPTPVADPATPAVPEGFVRIPVPEGHPLRDRGREFILAPKDEEADYRGMLGAAARRAELEQAHTEIAELRAREMRLQAREEARQKYADDPDIRELDARIAAVEGVDPITAAALKHRREALLGEKAEGRYTEMAREQWAGSLRAAGDQAESQALAIVRQRYPAEWLSRPESMQVWADATESFIAKARRNLRPGQAPSFDPAEIVREFDRHAVHDPWIRNHLSARLQKEQDTKAEQIRLAAEEKARADAAAAEQATLEANLQKRKRNPLGGLAVGTSTGQTVPTDRPPTSREYMQSVLR